MISPPLSLYAHFPWCVSKCPYCDFNSHAVQSVMPREDYLRALEADLAVQAPLVQGREIVSVFFGGGTPSLFTPDDIARVLSAIRRECVLATDAEVTLEANPGTIERGRFGGYRDAGVNRVSLGAQSFDPAILRTLGRIHSPDETRIAAGELHAAGLVNFNLDLMYALPAQDVEGAIADVDAAIALDPAHLSHYQLTLEPGTLFAARPPVLPSDDLAHEMLERCTDRLAAAGFGRYEVSAYARDGRESRHNLNYWRFGDYLGIGAGAHGKITHGPSIARSARLREPRKYMASAATPPEWKEVGQASLAFEFMMNALRLTEGFTPETFETRTGVPLATVVPELQRLSGQGLMQEASGHWATTPRGLDFLNEVLEAFLPDPDPLFTGEMGHRHK